MRIGFVSPYAWDIPGGVQAHIRDLAQYFKRDGHEVSILAPATDEDVPSDESVVYAGKPVAIPYNGAVARVLFGPVAASRVRQWIAKGEFDILHLHEPAIPSLSLLACSIAEGPMVGTFHVAAPRQKVAFAIAPLLEPVIEKLRARIAVSEIARETLRIHLDTDAVVIPNGIDSQFFRSPDVQRSASSEVVIGFIGRFDEPRKGLDVLIEALPLITRRLPNIKVLVAGPGDVGEALARVPAPYRFRVSFIGRLDEAEKAKFFNSIDIYVAPNTGGESFGIILAEAMAAGCAIVASNLPAFELLLDGGRLGKIFENGQSRSLADQIIELGLNPKARANLGEACAQSADRFDWQTVGPEIMNVYLHAIGEGERVTVGSEQRSWLRRFGRDEEVE